MSVPAYLQQTPYFLRITGVTDVQQVIDGLKGGSGPVGLAGWTNPSGDIIRMPTNSVGQYLQLELTRESATILNGFLRDDLGVATVSGEMHISGTVTVDCFFGAGYLHMQTSAATTEFMGIYLLTLAPEAQDAHRGYGFFQAYRNSTGGTGQSTSIKGIPWSFSLNAYSTNLAEDSVQIFNTNEYPTNVLFHQTGQGFRRWFPMIIWAANAPGTFKVMNGRVPNMLLMNSAVATPGSTIVIPIDEATTRSFRVLGMVNVNPAYRAAIMVP